MSSLNDESGKSEHAARTTSAFDAHASFQARQTSFFEAAISSLLKKIEELKARQGVTSEEWTSLREALTSGLEWMMVITVTGVEAYLVDVLALAAAKAPQIMNESDQRASYQEIVEASSTQELAAELRRRWARNVVDDGGPSKWIKRLMGLGAKGYPGDMAATLEELWGIRHMVIHNAGIASLDFRRRHPGVNLVTSGRIEPTQQAATKYLEMAEEFVKLTDRHFAAWHSSLEGKSA